MAEEETTSLRPGKEEAGWRKRLTAQLRGRSGAPGIAGRTATLMLHEGAAADGERQHFAIVAIKENSPPSRVPSSVPEAPRGYSRGALATQQAW